MGISIDGVDQKGKDLVNILREIAVDNNSTLLVDKHDCVSYLMAVDKGLELHKCYSCGDSEKYLSCNEYVPCMNKVRK